MLAPANRITRPGARSPREFRLGPWHPQNTLAVEELRVPCLIYSRRDENWSDESYDWQFAEDSSDLLELCRKGLHDLEDFVRQNI